MILYETTDRVEVVIGDITFKISPLTKKQKSLIQGYLSRWAKDNDITHLFDASYVAIKSAVKGMAGVKRRDGSDYILEFDDDGTLKEKCVEDLTNMHVNEKLSAVCMSILKGIPEKIVDDKGKEVEGIVIKHPQIGDTK